MYILFREDPWGNRVPHMAVNHREVASELMRRGKGFITRVWEVPRNVQTLIKM